MKHLLFIISLYVSSTVARPPLEDPFTSPDSFKNLPETNYKFESNISASESKANREISGEKSKEQERVPSSSKIESSVDKEPKPKYWIYNEVE